MAIRLMRVRLTNFARIKSGMNQDVLDLDFTKLPHPITLLVGANGSGKTSLLRCFHPFAYNGATGDEGKETTKLILPNKDGKKEVWLSYDEDVHYYVVHLYLRKKDGSITVKSYIKEVSHKYGEEELNESGSVTEFKAILSESFGIRESYLNLLSIGNTLDSFVKYTSSERKRYAVTLFNTLDLYPGFYKKATAMVREIKPLLTNVTAKLERYRTTDTSILESERQDKRKTINQLRRKVEKLLVEKGGYEKQIEGRDGILQTCKEAEDRIREISGEIEELRKKASGRKLEDLNRELESAQKDLLEATKSKEQTAMQMTSEIREKDSKVQTLTAIQNSLEKMEKDLLREELEETIAHLESEIAKLSIPTDYPRPQFTPNELIEVRLQLDQIRGLCADLLIEEAKYPNIILNVWEKLKTNPAAISDYVSTYSRAKNDLTIHRAAHPITRQLANIVDLLKDIPECDCDRTDSCVYALFYQQIKEAINDRKREADSNDWEKETVVDALEAKVHVANQIDTCVNAIHNGNLIMRLPESIFNAPQFIEDFVDTRDIYDRESLDYMIDIAERYQRKEEFEVEIDNLRQKIAMIEVTRSACAELYAKQDDLEKEIQTIDVRLQDLDKNFSYQRDKEAKLEATIFKLGSQIATDTLLTELRSELSTLREGLSAMKQEYQMVLDLQDRLTKTNSTIQDYNEQIAQSEGSIRSIEHTLLTIAELQQERSSLYERLQESTAIQEAVSPTEGIPMEFLRDSVGKELIRSVNQILSEVYHEKLILDEKTTVINENDFIIPYLWNGHRVDDIAQASDGQRAVLTMAFSIVLLEMTAPEYRTLLLDEADTTLDIHSRAVALELLENFTNKVGSGQVFNITHNAMFDGYPANILLTSDEVISNMDPKCVVLCYKGGNG